MGSKFYKWDYERYDFRKLENDVRNGNVGFNYGKTYNTKEEALKEICYWNINEKDDIYICFYNMPGAENQIWLKLEEVYLKDKKNNEYYCDKTIDGKYQKYCKVSKIKWIIPQTEENRFTFQERVIFGKLSKQQSGVKDITDKKDLIDKLKASEVNYSELKNNMSKIDQCYFCGKLSNDSKKYHEPFMRKNGLPYIETHHIVFQEIYRNNPDKKDVLNEYIYRNINNVLLLCPRCHRMIHNGTSEQVKEMIDIIKNDNLIMDNVNNVANLFGKNGEEYLEELYLSNRSY